MNRRGFLKLILAIPVLGALALFVSPLFRYLRPTAGPMTETRLDQEGNWTSWKGDGGLFSKPDMPTREREVVFDLAAFPTPWSSQTFTFGQKSREYSFKQYQSIRIPGYVVRLPDSGADGKPNFVVMSRICPHMGCVFNFLPDFHKAVEYNYNQATNPLFACPCHLSVFDPLKTQAVDGKAVRGKVVSGPAPRPPRHFEWAIDGNKLVITAVEAGGIS
jgi:Rieske Fe-S protein